MESKYISPEIDIIEIKNPKVLTDDSGDFNFDDEENLDGTFLN